VIGVRGPGPAIRRLGKWARTDATRRDVTFLVLLAVAVAAADVVWRGIETRPPHWDMARHLLTSLQYRGLLDSGEWFGFLTNYYYYPPLLYWLTQPLYAALGTDVQVAVVTNCVFILVLVLSLYGIGVELHDRRSGRLAAMFALSLPFVVSQFKEYQVDAPLTAMVALALFALIRAREFSDVRASYAFGVVAGLGLLTKWTFAIVMAAPLAYALLVAVRARHPRPVRPVLGALAVTLVIAGPWYASNVLHLGRDLLENAYAAGAREGDPALASFESLIWYPTRLVQEHLYLVPTLLFIGGLLRWNRRNLYPLLLVVGLIVEFTLLENKDARYIMPAMVGIAIIATSWLPRRRWIGPALLAYTVVAFEAISFGNPLLPPEVDVGPVDAFAQHGYIIGAPTHEDWHLQEAVAQVAARWPGGTVSYAGLDTIWCNPWDVRYYAAKYGLTYVERDADATITRGNVGVALPDGTRLTIVPQP
jgi:4-amino-4-deoxy-L-arabinose transferase-like glycosyltransferase